MKNPFEKKDNTVLIVSIALGSVVAGAAAYLFLTEKGNSLRSELADQFNKLSSRIRGEAEEVEERAVDYIQKKTKKPKTDREALLHGEILSPEHGGSSQG